MPVWAGWPIRYCNRITASVARSGMLGFMAKSRNFNLEKVRESLDAVCSKCGALISPPDVRRVDFERIECPVCGERFVPSP